MSRDLKRLCKIPFEPEFKYKGVRRLVEASSIVESSPGSELEESERRQGVSSHYKI